MGLELIEVMWQHGQRAMGFPLYHSSHSQAELITFLFLQAHQPNTPYPSNPRHPFICLFLISTTRATGSKDRRHCGPNSDAEFVGDGRACTGSEGWFGRGVTRNLEQKGILKSYLDPVGTFKYSRYCHPSSNRTSCRGRSSRCRCPCC